MTDGVLIDPAINRTLLAIQGAQQRVDRTTLNLSTGKDVNKALDNPNSFFSSQALKNRSGDLLRLIDGINRSIAVIEESLYAVEALESLLVQAETIAIESQTLQNLGEVDPDIYEVELDDSLSPLRRQILNSRPDGYWQLNDAGNPALNQGAGGAALDGNYQGVTLGGPELYVNGAGTSGTFDGNNDRVIIPNSGLINIGNQSQRTIEMVFNADDVTAGAGRQILWEEGGNTNSLNMYIDNGRLYFVAHDQGDFTAVVSTPINSGQTYHATLVFDFPGSGTLSGYLDGQFVGSSAVTRALSSHTGGIAIGALNGRSYMHDGPSAANTHYFGGNISDVALYNDALDANTIETHFRSLSISSIIEYRHREFENILEQVDMLVNDASFRGSTLLDGSSIETRFNEFGTSSLVTEGIDFSTLGLEIERNDFNDPDDLQDVIDSVRFALGEVRSYGIALTNDLLILQTRASFTENFSNTLEEGSDKLVLADLNAESAKLLASQTRLNLAVSALNAAAIFNATILNIFNV